MSDKQTGVGAEVGVKKINEDGVVTQRGGASKPPFWAVVIFYVLVVLSALGAWKVIELLLGFF